MESDSAIVAALIFILLMIGATKGGDSRWMSALRDSLKNQWSGQRINPWMS